MKKEEYLPLILIILDGWGIDKEKKGNPIALAPTPSIDSYCKDFSYTEIFAHGKYVGLPKNQVGNSEAGHMNIGAGRLVEQDVVRISKSISDKTFFKNPAFAGAVRHVKKKKSCLHLVGMLSSGQSPHSDPSHLLALLKLLREKKVDKIILHLFTDGRDSPKYASSKLLSDLEKELKPNEKIGTIMGRFYSMDRKKAWDRTEKAYKALVYGEGRISSDARAAVLESYNRGESDEFIQPCIIRDAGKNLPRIGDNDSVIFFNLRSDRARQLAKVFVQKKFYDKNPHSFKRSKILKHLYFVALTDFGPDLDDIITAYPGIDIVDTLPMQLSALRQLYITETEKYAHVTYFLNGGYPGKVAGEDQFMINSPRVLSYDETPIMSTKLLVDKILVNLKKDKYDFTFLNIAAPDMIGHTGTLSAGLKCCTGVDEQVSRIVKAYLKVAGTVIVTADHGNIEEMINLKTDEIDTEHSTNKVPFILINKKIGKRAKLRVNGSLGDIAPTILDLLKIDKSSLMSGKSLITKI